MNAIPDIQQQAPASRFKRLSLVWIIAAVLAAGIGGSAVLVKILIERDQQFHAGAIGGLLDRHFQTSGNSAMAALFSSLKRYHHVERMTVYNAAGNVIWSSNKTQDIFTRTDARLLEQTFQDKINFRYTRIDNDQSAASGRLHSYFLPWVPDVLLPIHNEDNSIVTVARITRVPELLLSELILGLGILWGILGISGSAYYLFSYRLFTRTSNELVTCELDLEKSRRLAELGECVSMIVHDTRNLMASIRFILGCLRNDQLTTDQRHKLIDGAERPLEMSFAMMEDLLGFVSGKKPPLLCHKHQLKQLLDEGEDMLQAMLQTTGHELILEVPDDLVIYWDAQKLLHILVNLVRNAAESMETPGKVTIVAAREEGGVRIFVRDTGPGIPEQMLPTLFEPFVSQTGKSRPGLGLAIIRELVRRHGGDVVASNLSAGGAEFNLYFPDCPEYIETDL